MVDDIFHENYNMLILTDIADDVILIENYDMYNAVMTLFMMIILTLMIGNIMQNENYAMHYTNVCDG